MARTETKTPIDKLLSTNMKVPAGVKVNFEITASHSSLSKKHATNNVMFSRDRWYQYLVQGKYFKVCALAGAHAVVLC